MLKLDTLKISYVFTFILVLILSLFLNITFLAINSVFLKMLKQILQESFFSNFVSLMPVNLSQYRGTVGVLNNRNIALCNFCNIWYSQSFRNCSTFIFFNAVHACLNLILYISILVLCANHFWLYEIVLKLSGDIEENP